MWKWVTREIDTHSCWKFGGVCEGTKCVKVHHSGGRHTFGLKVLMIFGRAPCFALGGLCHMVNAFIWWNDNGESLCDEFLAMMSSILIVFSQAISRQLILCSSFFISHPLDTIKKSPTRQPHLHVLVTPAHHPTPTAQLPLLRASPSIAMTGAHGRIPSSPSLHQPSARCHAWVSLSFSRSAQLFPSPPASSSCAWTAPAIRCDFGGITATAWCCAASPSSTARRGSSLLPLCAFFATPAAARRRTDHCSTGRTIGGNREERLKIKSPEAANAIHTIRSNCPRGNLQVFAYVCAIWPCYKMH